jgi:hypothetical protein
MCHSSALLDAGGLIVVLGWWFGNFTLASALLVRTARDAMFYIVPMSEYFKSHKAQEEEQVLFVITLCLVLLPLPIS